MEFKTVEEAHAAGRMAWWRPLVVRVDEILCSDSYNRDANTIPKKSRWVPACPVSVGEKVDLSMLLYRRLVIAPEGAPDPGEGFRLLVSEEMMLDDEYYSIGKKWHRVQGYGVGVSSDKCMYVRRKLDPSVQDEGRAEG